MSNSQWDRLTLDSHALGSIWTGENHEYDRLDALTYAMTLYSQQVHPNIRQTIKIVDIQQTAHHKGRLMTNDTYVVRFATGLPDNLVTEVNITINWGGGCANMNGQVRKIQEPIR